METKKLGDRSHEKAPATASAILQDMPIDGLSERQIENGADLA